MFKLIITVLVGMIMITSCSIHHPSNTSSVDFVFNRSHNVNSSIEAPDPIIEKR